MNLNHNHPLLPPPLFVITDHHLNMSAHLSNIFAVTKPIVHDTPEQVQSCMHVTATLEHTLAIGQLMLDNVEQLQEEQEHWVKEWEVALVCGTSFMHNTDTNHA